jgi:hypothetical protein
MVLRTLAWLCVPVAGLVELGGHFYFSSRAPKLNEWVQSRAALDAIRRPGDLVVVAPDWAEPNARLAYGDAAFPLADVARPDESAYPRAIEVSIIGAAAPELRGWKTTDERRHGKFRYRVLENPRPAKVLYDFVNHVAEATVADLGPSGAASACRWNPRAVRTAGGLHGDPAFPSQRHECAGGGGRFVGTTVIEDEQWRGRRCLWAMPPNQAVLSIRYPEVSIGQVVRGYAALPQWVERDKRGAPVEMEVFAGGESIGKYLHRDGDGWKAFSFSTGGRAGSITDIEFRVKSARPHDRQFCFQADTR